MSTIDAFLRLTEAYCAAVGIAEATLSTRLFSDGKRIAEVRRGSDIGSRRLSRAVEWLSANWPDDLDWAADIARPPPAVSSRSSLLPDEVTS